MNLREKGGKIKIPIKIMRRRTGVAPVSTAVATTVIVVIFLIIWKCDLSDGKSLLSPVKKEGSSREMPVKPMSYASFIIKLGRPPTILLEEQDRFEFPDKRVRVRVKGSDFPLERRKTEDQIYLFRNTDNNNNNSNSSSNISESNKEDNNSNSIADIVNGVLDENNDDDDNTNNASKTNSSSNVGSETDTDNSSEEEIAQANNHNEDENTLSNASNEGDNDAGQSDTEDHNTSEIQEEHQHSHHGDSHDHPYSDKIMSPPDHHNHEHEHEHPYSDKIRSPPHYDDNDDDEVDYDSPVDVDQSEKVQAQPPTKVDYSYEVHSITVGRYVGASSVFWSKEEGAIYVTDAYSGRIHRYTKVDSENPNKFVGPELTLSLTIAVERSKSPRALESKFDDDYSERMLTLKNKDSGYMLGPIINVFKTDDSNLVNLTLTVNSHAVNVTWDLDSGNREDKMDLPDHELENTCVEECSRYQRFTVAKRDVEGRTYLGISDIRHEVAAPTKIANNIHNDAVTMHKYDNNKGDMETVDAMDSMARVASSFAPQTTISSSVFTFSSSNPDKLFYSDGASSDLVIFEYDYKSGTTNGRYNVSTALSPPLLQMGLFPLEEEEESSLPQMLPTAMTVSRKQLWVALKGGQEENAGRKIATLDATTLKEIGTLSGDAFDGDIHDMVAMEYDYNDDDLPAVLVLTRHSLYKVVTVL